jgi:hypothetical protein
MKGLLQLLWLWQEKKERWGCKEKRKDNGSEEEEKVGLQIKKNSSAGG